MGVFKEIEKADGSGVTTFYRLSDVHDTVETDDSEGTATVIDYNAAQNKPSVNGVALVGNKTSEDLGLQPAGDYITNDEADAKFIDEDELEAKNYVNETRLQEAIANIDHFHREIVNALPVTGQDNVLYMVRKQGSGEDIFNEYIWVGKTVSETGYEFIGTTATDLTDYYQKDEVDNLLSNKVDKVNGKGLSEQNYTLAEKTKLAGLENYDDTEIQAEVSGLNTDVNNLKSSNTNITNTLTELKPNVESNTAAVSTIYDLLDNKMTAIRLVEQGDGWVWMNLEGSRLTYAQASAALGHENCMLFIEQLENDGKVIPAEYKSEGDHINVIFKDLDSLVHIMTCGEDDAIVTEDVTTTDGQVDFTVENEAVDYTTKMTTLYGDSYQKNYTGKNLLKNTSTNSGDNNYWSGYSTFDENTGTLTRSTTATTENFIVHRYNLKNNTKYTVSCDIKHNGYVNGAEIFVYNITASKIYSKVIPITTNFVRQSFTFTTDDTGFENAIIRFDNNGSTQSGTEATLTIKNVMLVEGEDTDFEPYTNGPSPNPDYPQDIYVVSGDNKVITRGKNLFNLTGLSSSLISGAGSEITFDGTKSDNGYIINQSLGTFEAGTYTFSFNRKSGSINLNSSSDAFVVRVGNSSLVTYSLNSTSENRTFTLEKEMTVSVRYWVNANIVYNNLVIDFQLEKSPTITDYEPYQGKEYLLNIGNIKLCKIGEYQDKIYKENDRWYLHKEIGKIVLDGSETITAGVTETNYARFNVAIADVTTSTYTGIRSNYYYPKYAVEPGAIFISSTQNIISIIHNSNISLNDFKTWLGTARPVIYYVLATPTDTEITDATLLAQLNALEQITQYKQTYITITGANLTPEADFTYIRNIVINNSDTVLGKDTYWNNEVPTQADLPSNAEEGEIRIVQDTQNVYIYDGYEWIPFDKGGEIDLSNYLAKDNTTAWIPTGAFNPATKKYVDDSVGGVFVPTKTSQLTNDSNFIGKNSNDLTYYYTKSQTYTKSEVDALIGGGGGGGNVSITVSGDTLVITTE